MGFARNTLSCIISSTSTQRPGETFTVLSLHISNIYAKKRVVAKKLILSFRAFMIGQHVDLVAGHFNGTAWRCSSRDNISSIEEAFADCALPTPPGPTPLFGRFQTTGRTCVDSSSHRAQIGIGKCACTAHFPFHMKLLAYDQTIKVAIMRHGST